eukprot:TRINITY_DN11982_c0_g1_i1.p1 TRINITY_DN11982_c0_g1~~TRINITY_DN11982_c0_g1_i1.p1  ORF type:complete len:121 (-),score=34.16 TRINITY_DN11982_c0_g1_i1:52-384(-)
MLGAYSLRCPVLVDTLLQHMLSHNFESKGGARQGRQQTARKQNLDGNLSLKKKLMAGGEMGQEAALVAYISASILANANDFCFGKNKCREGVSVGMCVNPKAELKPKWKE